MSGLSEWSRTLLSYLSFTISISISEEQFSLFQDVARYQSLIEFAQMYCILFSPSSAQEFTWKKCKNSQMYGESSNFWSFWLDQDGCLHFDHCYCDPMSQMLDSQNVAKLTGCVHVQVLLQMAGQANLIMTPRRVTDSLSSVLKELDECDTFLSLQRVLVKKVTSYELVLNLLWCDMTWACNALCTV